MNRLIRLRRKTVSFLHIVAALVSLTLLSKAPAVSPAPDGSYSGFNTAEGSNALLSLGTGTWNTAIGASALKADISGSFNTAVGGQALLHNTGGTNNTAVGVNALLRNTSGGQNMALGGGALANNTIGSNNTAMGFQALKNNTSGDRNTAMGYRALYAKFAGGSIDGDNTAVGYGALLAAFGECQGLVCLRAARNTAVGSQALYNVGSGTDNIALGFQAGFNVNGDLNIDIGNKGVVGESGTIRVGSPGFHTRTFIAGIRGVTTGVANAVNVVIDSAGQLGTASSSRRFKNEIKPMDKTSEAILALKPVTFHYKSDSTGTPQFGLIAEEVAKVNPDLVVCDENGKIYTVRYDAVNAMLLNEFLKEHKIVQEQGATITELKNEVAVLTATVKEQATEIQKVSAQFELNKPAPQTVANNQ